MLPNKSLLSRIELFTCVCAVIWLQLVGIIDRTVVHHIFHSLPVLLILFLPKTPLTRLLAVLTAFAWIFMLSIVTPMLNYAIIRGYLISHSNLSYTWLAVGMALISAVWMAENLTLLSGKKSNFILFATGSIILIPVLAFIQPYISLIFEIPLRRTLNGQYFWGLIFLAELPAVLFLPWWIAIKITHNNVLVMLKGKVLYQVMYWVFFLTSMIIGLLPALNTR
ncbi:MAG: hypothetical protein GXP33_10140 [Spirochaetes bacterium]|nr:hypothetical protein [Spirochaetota bacterium]